MPTKPIILLAFALLAAEARANEAAANIVVTNRSNKTAACATATFDAASQSAATRAWFVVANGASLSLGAGSYVYCEQEGNPAVWWNGNGPSFCVNTPAEYVNPIFYADRSSECLGLGGQMRPFKEARGNGGTYTWTLRP